MRATLGQVIALSVLLFGCQHVSPPSHGKEPPSTISATSARTTGATETTAPLQPYSWCPMRVPGTRVDVQDVPNGAALVFHTTGDVGAVRARVGEMAFFHDQLGTEHPTDNSRHFAQSSLDEARRYIAHAAQPSGANPRSMSKQAISRAMHESRAQFEDTGDGAELVLTAKLPWDIHLVRHFVDWRARHMANDGCAIMGKPWPAAQATS